MRRPLLCLASALLVAACGGGEEEAPTPTSSSSAVATTTPAPTTPPETTAPPSEPSPTPTFHAIGSAEVEHGRSYWAVYLAAAEPGDPTLDEAASLADTLGILSFPGDIGCDDRAAEALGVPADVFVVGVYFETRDEAVAFADTLESPPVGVARVTTYCAD